MGIKLVAWTALLSQVFLCGFVAGGLLEQEPILEKLLKDPHIADTARLGFDHTIEEMRKIAENYNQGDYPQFDSYKNESIRIQIRKNMLAICNQMLTLSNNGYETAPGRIADIKTVQSLYLEDDIFNARRIPKYYHATTSIKHVDQILESKYIKANPAYHYGAWTASCFYYTHWIFAFSSELELPISEVSKDSYFMGPCWALGRLHNIEFWDSDIELVAWAVPAEQFNETLAYIQTLDNSTASYYSKIGLTNEQMILERHLITLAQIYSSDRANALLTHALNVTSNLYSMGSQNCSLGEVVMFEDPSNKFVPRYGACTNNTSNDIIPILNFNAISRSNKITMVSRSTVQTTNMIVADLSAANDAMKLVQLIADGKLVAKPQRMHNDNAIMSS